MLARVVNVLCNMEDMDWAIGFHRATLGLPVKFAVFEDPNGNLLQIYQCVR